VQNTDLKILNGKILHLLVFFPTGMFLNMAQVPPRFYNQQIQQQRDNYQQTKKNYYRAGSSGMSQEHQGSASQVRFFFFLPLVQGLMNTLLLVNTLLPRTYYSSTHFAPSTHFGSQLTLPRRKFKAVEGLGSI
jgi:hypothetical protein